MFGDTWMCSSKRLPALYFLLCKWRSSLFSSSLIESLTGLYRVVSVNITKSPSWVILSISLSLSASFFNNIFSISKASFYTISSNMPSSINYSQSLSLLNMSHTFSELEMKSMISDIWISRSFFLWRTLLRWLISSAVYFFNWSACDRLTSASSIFCWLSWIFFS